MIRIRDDNAKKSSETITQTMKYEYALKTIM